MAKSLKAWAKVALIGNEIYPRTLKSRVLDPEVASLSCNFRYISKGK